MFGRFTDSISGFRSHKYPLLGMSNTIKRSFFHYIDINFFLCYDRRDMKETEAGKCAISLAEYGMTTLGHLCGPGLSYPA